jgi:hypothetical protein
MPHISHSLLAYLFRKYVYDYNIKVKWKGVIATLEGENIEATGTLELIDVMVDDDDYQVTFFIISHLINLL